MRHSGNLRLHFLPILQVQVLAAGGQWVDEELLKYFIRHGSNVGSCLGRLDHMEGIAD